MQNHKIIKTLASLAPETCRRFSSFLASPYHTKSSKLKALGLYLLSHYPDFDSPDFTESNIYHSFYPEKAFSKHELTRYFSKLRALLDDFFIQESLDNSPFMKGALLEKYYYELMNEAGLQKARKANLDQLKNSIPVESVNHFYTYLSQKTKHKALMQQVVKLGAKEVYIEAAGALHSYFLIELLQAATVLVYQHKFENPSSVLPLLEQSVNYAKSNVKTLPFLAKLWLFAYQLAFNPNDIEAYSSLKQAFKSNLKKLGIADGRNFAVILAWSLRFRDKLSRAKLIEESFEFYLIEIQESWIIVDHTIPFTTFNNVVSVALALKQIAWAEDFIQGHQQYLAEAVREDVSKYNFAKIHFIRGDYQACLKNTRTLPFLNVTVTLGIKRLEIMCFFELRKIDAFFRAIHAFTMFLHRLDAKYARYGETNSLFIKFVKDLFRYLEKGNSLTDESLKKMEETLSQNCFLPEAEWIQLKIDSMK